MKRHFWIRKSDIPKQKKYDFFTAAICKRKPNVKKENESDFKGAIHLVEVKKKMGKS